jgi:tryptophan-rich sensory protein
MTATEDAWAPFWTLLYVLAGTALAVVYVSGEAGRSDVAAGVALAVTVIVDYRTRPEKP